MKVAGKPTPKVLNANRMIVMLVAIIAFAWLRDVACFVEQPSSSILRFFGPFAPILRLILTHTCRTYLGAFGSSTVKPIDIYSSEQEVAELQRKKPQKTRKLTTRKGHSVTGKVTALKNSSAYPTPFGYAVRRVIKTIMKKHDLGRLFSNFPEAVH